MSAGAPDPGALLPLSPQQLGVWASEQVAETPGLWTVPITVEFARSLDATTLTRCLTALVDRHESFRTSFLSGDDGPVRRVAAPGSVTLEIVETLLHDNDGDEVARIAARCAEEPFDLERAPLSRVTLLRYRDTTVLVWCFHHLIVDLVSVRVLLGELDQLLQGGQLSAAAPAYSDYVRAQCDARPGARPTGASTPRLLNLPIPPFTLAAGDLTAAFVEAEVDPRVRAAVAGLARTCAVLPSAPYTAAWLLTLALACAQERVAVGVPSANRGARRFRNLVGLVTSTESIDVAIDASTLVRDLVRQVSDELRKLAMADGTQVTDAAPTKLAGFRPAPHDAVISYVLDGTGAAATPAGARLIEGRPAALRQLLNLELVARPGRTQLILAFRAAVLPKEVAEELVRIFLAVLEAFTANADATLASAVAALDVGMVGSDLLPAGLAGAADDERRLPAAERWLDFAGRRVHRDVLQAAVDQVLPAGRARITVCGDTRVPPIAEIRCERVSGDELDLLRTSSTLPLDWIRLAWSDRKTGSPTQVAAPAGPGPAQSDSAVVTAVHQVWREVFRLNEVDPGHDVFEVGGTSLDAARLANRLSRLVGRRVTMRNVMDAPSLQDLSILVSDMADDAT